MDPLTIGATAFGAATSAYGAYAQNQALSHAAGSYNQAARVQTNQVASQGAAERGENRRTADQIAARARVLSIAAGGSAGSVADIDRTLVFDAARNAQISRDNEAARIAAIRSGNEAALASLRGQARLAILDTISGGLYGLSTGLSISSALRESES